MRPAEPTRLAVPERIRRLRAPGARLGSGLFAIEGVRNLVAAFDAGATVEQLCVSSRLLRSPIGQRIVRRLRRAGTPCHMVSPEDFRGFSTARRASGVAAIVRQHWTPLHRARADHGTCWVALRGTRSPGNLGTILRTADAAGAAGLFALGDDVDPFDPIAVRGSMGSLFRQRCVRTTRPCLRDWARDRGCKIVGACPNASLPYHDAELHQPTVLFLGEEGSGLDDEDRHVCDELVRIPMVGPVDSLNVGVAAGILLFEVLRRHGSRDF